MQCHAARYCIESLLPGKACGTRGACSVTMADMFKHLLSRDLRAAQLERTSTTGRTPMSSTGAQRQKDMSDPTLGAQCTGRFVQRAGACNSIPDPVLRPPKISGRDSKMYKVSSRPYTIL
jgi:hypothetical protein